jgi:hypothetical protein
MEQIVTRDELQKLPLGCMSWLGSRLPARHCSKARDNTEARQEIFRVHSSGQYGSRRLHACHWGASPGCPPVSGPQRLPKTRTTPLRPQSTRALHAERVRGRPGDWPRASCRHDGYLRSKPLAYPGPGCVRVEPVRVEARRHARKRRVRSCSRRSSYQADVLYRARGCHRASNGVSYDIGHCHR